MGITTKLANFLGLRSTTAERTKEQDEAQARQRQAMLSDFLSKGEVAMDRGYAADAETWLRQALALAPNDEKANLFLGIALALRNQEAAAVKYLEAALAANPASFAASYNLSMAKLTLKKFDEAEAHCRQALLCRPGDAQALIRLSAILKEQWRIPEALEACRQVTVSLPHALQAHTGLLWLLQYVTEQGQAEIFEAHRLFGVEIAKAIPIRQDAYAGRHLRPQGERRLKVGYLSSDLRAHPVALFLLPLLEHHDKARFEVFCYSTSSQSDGATAKIAARTEHFVKCSSLSNAGLADRIIADEIDILVDLGGHTVGNRLEVFAERPAPVQMTWLGYVDTTGMSSMDYRLTCEDADPPENEAFHSEKLVRLNKHLHFVFRPDDGLPELTKLPALDRGHITFLSNNQVEKITPKMLAAWAEILKRLPRSRLVIMAMSGADARNKIMESFSAAGIDPDRLTMHGRVQLQEFRRLVMECDLGLDTFPFNGATTTAETLCVGIPIITLKGQRFASRVGFAIMKQLGLEHFVASSFDAYVQTAVRAAQDIDGLSALRAQLRERVEASPLRDELGFTRSLEDAYRTMMAEWRARCASQVTEEANSAVASP